MATSGLSLFHPLIRQWFVERYGTSTDIQEKTWPVVAAGGHVLVTAPTGCGKTLAAFLWALNQLITGAWTRGAVRVLYVSPLKALNNDVRLNLLEPLEDLNRVFSNAGVSFLPLSVLTRSGDTPGEERRRMVRKPPEILITTPESLNLLLSSRSGRTLLTGVATVILDEIHAVVGSKRGTHLITAVDRLVPLSGEFQRIALSATVSPPGRVAEFVGGFRLLGKGADIRYEKRYITVIQSRQAKSYELKVSFPSDARQKIVEGSWWPALIDEFRRIITIHRATLFFANSRRTTEKVTRLINEGEGGEVAYAHHGSLSREIRLAVETQLKQGRLKAIVATNSLELGIDIGSLDQVVLIQTPRSVSAALQRVGRSGHRVGEVSRGILFPIHGRDFVDAAVMARMVLDQEIEEVRLVEAPLDVLAQVILSMTAMERWDIDGLYGFVKTSYPFRNLPRRHYDILIDMLAGRYADTRLRALKPRVSLDRIDNTVQANSEVPYLIYTSGGTIPERGYFDMRLTATRAKIGELDEEFVWERSVGDTFTLGTRLWRIEKITHNDVEVVPARSAAGMIPFWKAEEQDRDHHLSEKIGLFLEHADERLGSAEFRQELLDRHFMEAAAADELIGFLKLQKEATGTSLPNRHYLLIEHVEDENGREDLKQVILHTFWGGRVNRPYSLALAEAWEERERTPLPVVVDDDALLVMLPRDYPARDLFALLTPENVELFLRRRLEKTGFFGARFRENAERALLLPKSSFKRRMPLWLVRLRSKELLEAVRAYEDFPVLIETWRTCLQDEFDLVSLKAVLEEVRTGAVRLGQTITRSASPFAGRLVWKQTNTSMYDDDTPILARESALRPDLIKELLFSPHLRPRIPDEVLRSVDAKLKRTAPGYPPGSDRELLDWVKDRLLMPEQEWNELAAAIRKDTGADGQAWLSVNGRKLAWVSWPGVRHRLLCAIETLPKVLVAFRLLLEDASLEPVAPPESGAGLRRRVKAYLRNVPEAAAPSEEFDLSGFLSAWLAFYGPVEKGLVAETLGITAVRLDEAIEPLIEAQELVMDRFGEGSVQLEICDSENLGILLRTARRFRQPSFEALPLSSLPLFLAQYQGITSRGTALDDLQQRLEQLFGWPARVEAWEEHLLPARMQPYRAEWLDSLMAESDLLWFGCGERRISLAFSQDLDLFRPPDGGHQEGLSELDQLIPERRGRYSFLEIADSSHLDSITATQRIWRQAWKGSVTSDTFRTVRRGVLTGFAARSFSGDPRSTSRRSGFDRWKVSRPLEGHWRRIDTSGGAPDILAAGELVKDRVRQLLRRYGILFRELLANELDLLQWRSVFRTLRLMELSGEVLSGYFFEGIPGPQFIFREAFRMIQEPLARDAIYWINALDPASLCGLFSGPDKLDLPPRIASTYLVYHGSRLVMVVKRQGKTLDILVEPSAGRFSGYCMVFRDLLGREFNPLRRISIETINGLAALHSPYAAPLREFGFRSGVATLDLWKEP
ncbi:MAG: DEAD/DEAH box helicase [Nitrospirota bacterium]